MAIAGLAKPPSGLIPTNDTGAISWWVFSDNATNTQITSWPDRITGNPWTNTVALAPTNSANGMGFDGSHAFRLKNEAPLPNTAGHTNWAFVILNAAPSPNNVGYVLQYQNTFGSYNGNNGFYTLSSPSWNWHAFANHTWTPFNSNVKVDLLALWISSASSFTLYTNGVLVVNDPSGGADGAGYDQLGLGSSGGTFYKGYILEVAFGTTNLNSGSISNFHYYATNTYNYAP